MRKVKYVKTPIEHITIGECVRTAAGELALKIKKPNKDKYEVISMSQLVEMMVAESN